MHSFGPKVERFFAAHPDWLPDTPSHCPEGWDELLGQTLSELLDLSERTGQGIRILQIKQKWAELRVYLRLEGQPATFTIDILSDSGLSTYRTGDPADLALAWRFHEIVDDAAVRSRSTCEICGQPGMPRHGGWVRVFCDEHAGSRP